MKITAERFRQLMVDPDIPEHELRQYLTIDEERSRPFSPKVIPDPEKVEMSEAEQEFESALGFGNTFSRWRRRRVFERRRRRGDPSPVLVSEGDSWFQFPFLIDDVIDHLGTDHLVWSSGAAGDTARNMVFTQPEYLEALDQQADQVRAFLLSAAGNDVIGEDANGDPMLAGLVKQAQGGEPPESLIDRHALSATMDGLRFAYRTVVAQVRADSRFERLPIVIHGYDYCFPGSPDDPRDPIYAAPDQWLGRALRSRGVTSPELQREVLKILIDELYEMLFAIAAEDEAEAVYVVDARGAMPSVDDWADEIHGTDQGFAKVAERFRQALDIAIGKDERSPFARFRGLERARRNVPCKATIVIDPGHGGTEKVGGSSPNNATGPGGTLEKELTLKVGLLLREELAERGHRALMTRASDRNPALADRARVARDAAADVFLSIHFNGWRTPTVQGTETFRHRGGSVACGLLAELLHDTVRQATGRLDRGVKEARFGVLRPSRHAAETACCLSEVSFLTDPDEEARLQDPRYLTRIAKAMANGIEQYLSAVARAQPGRFEATAATAHEGEAVAEYEDAVEQARQAEASMPASELRVRPSRALDRRALGGDPAVPELDGFSDVARFLGAWRDRRRVSRGFDPSRLERQIGTDDTLPSAFLTSGAAVASAVCKIEASGVSFDGTPGSWTGTGFVVGPNLLLTNNHVLHDVQTARGAMAVFSYEVGEDGRFVPRRTYTLDPDVLFVTSPARGGLDFTFVHIDGDAHEVFGTIGMKRGSFVLAPGERANLVHHPGGKPKRVSLRSNRSIDFDEIFLHYVSDTESGSSGAPVLDDTWALIALHHAWDDVPANLRLPERFPETFLNEGVKLSAIAVDLESRLATPDAAQARRVLNVIGGSDSLTGYFGAAGRRADGASLSMQQRVETVYRGGAQDVDIGYWDAAWFAERPRERASDTATVLVDLNLDIWTLTNCPPQAAEILLEQLRVEYGQEFSMRNSARREVATFWNPMTLDAREAEWPATPDFCAPPLLRFNAHRLRRERGLADYEFYLATIAEDPSRPGAEHRANAEALAAAVAATSNDADDADWVIAGAQMPDSMLLAFAGLGVSALGAEDTLEGAVIFARSPASLTDEIFVPPSMTRCLGGGDYLRHVQDADSPERVLRMSGRRPLMMRLSLLDAESRRPDVRQLPDAATRPAPVFARTTAEAREHLIREFLEWHARRNEL